MLAGRRIVLGISGGVAAYKAAYLARRLVEHGARVRTVMTRSATKFLGPQTIAAITGEHPHTELFGAESVSPHTELARWADLIVVAPATTATIGRLAAGMSEDLLSATVMASIRPLVVAPAMHTEMWEHPATQRNIDRLRADGATVVGPGVGALAGGDEGAGRMAEPDEIVAAVAGVFEARAGDLAGWRVLVSAGGTREPIDPVRFVGNRSSGKMGHAIAREAAVRGAAVALVTTVDFEPVSGVEVVAVETAAEMAEAVWSRAGAVEVAVLTAAVADFRPATPRDAKLKRAEGDLEVTFERTPDILAGVAAMHDRPFLVGFAAETGSLDDAVDKARRKGVDLLVGNDVAKEGSGFGTDTNEVTLVMPDGTSEPWELMSKAEVASRLWDRIRDLRRSVP